MTSEGEGCKGYAVVLSVILVIILDSFWNTDQWVDGFSIILYDIVKVLDKTEKKIWRYCFYIDISTRQQIIQRGCVTDVSFEDEGCKCNTEVKTKLYSIF